MTGSAGLFVPTQGTVLDTRTGIGGVSGPVAANTWYPVQITGQAGVPASGVSSVQVSVTVLTPAATGLVKLAPNGTTDVHVAALTYTANGGSISASSIVAVAADGKIGVLAQTSVTLLVHVQGYYTAGNGSPAPGGYVPVTPTRLVDTRTGTGLPQAKLATNSTTAITVGGLAGVPADASAAFLMLTAISTSSTAGYFSPYPTGTTRPANVSLNYLANTATILGAAVDLGTGGQFNLWVGPAGTAIDVVVDVVGYYTAVPGSKGAFTPAATRVYDSRLSPNVQLPANGSRRIQAGGVAGVPLPGSGISALAVSAQIVHSGTNSGSLALGPGDQRSAAVSAVYFSPGSNVRSDLVIVPTAGDGTVLLVNSSPDPVHVILDVEGWYSAVGAAIPAGQSRTQENLTLQADPSGGGSWVTYQYRVGITGSWTNVPVADVTVPGTTTHPAGWPVAKAGSPAAFQPYTWDAGATLNHGDQLFQVQACYGSSATDPSPVCSMASSVQLATHAFGDSYATASVGPGSLSLLTGDYQLSAGDVSVPTYLGALSIGRSFTTLAPVNAERTDASGVFGPGWTAALPGSDTGAADLVVADHTSEGYLSFTGSDGSVSVYQATSPTGSYPVSFAGVDDAAAAGATVTKVSATEVDLLGADGSTTVWTLNPTTHLGTATSVREAGTAGTTSYSRDGAGRVTRILGAVPAGLSCASPDTTPGCRSLTLSYGSVPVGGASVSRLVSVVFHAYDPATSAMAAVPVASYDYDSTGRLAHAWDPRITPNLKTGYSYDAAGRLTGLTPPGLATWTFGYTGSGRLATVSRYDPALAQTATTTIAYGVAFTGSGAPIDLGAAAVAAWGQTDLPATATAVFEPNRVPAGTPTAADWPYATIHYLDVNGRETNTASYGAGAWQYGATGYDSNGNSTWSLTPGNRAQALNPTPDTDPAASALAGSAARAALLASSELYDPLNPERLTDSYGPVHPVLLADGSTVDGRSHGHTVYDQGAPLDGAGNPLSLGLPTTVTTAAWDLATAADRDPVTVRTGYSAVAVGGSKTGWDLGRPTSTTTVGAGANGADLVSNTRYNDAGQTVQSWLPASTGSDARATSTNYYTATGTGPCVAPAFAGLMCSTGPTAQPGTGNPLPVTTTSYNLYNEPVTITETAGSTVRTTTRGYDAAGRPTSSAIAVTPAAAGGTALPAVTTGYQATTGLPTTLTAGGQTLTTDYDTFGRVYRYTDSTGTVSTRTYDIRGLVTGLNDGKGTYGYTYDSATEHRGLMSAEDLGVGAAPGSFTAVYDANGNLAVETYPNGLTATSRFDNDGRATSLIYSAGATTWLSFSQLRNAQGDVARQSSPQSSQTFGYDSGGRLVRTEDTVGGACTTRKYTLDGDSNRTVLQSYPPASGGACSTTTTAAVTQPTYDGADRLTSSGYGYDSLGRISTIPAADALGIGSHATVTGSLAMSYYSNDMVAGQTQGGRVLGFTLDPVRNRIVGTTDTAGPTSTNHYADSGDSPAWTGTGTGWVRNLKGINGTLEGLADQAGSVVLQLRNLRGDIVATVPDTAGATGIASYFEASEFGVPRSPATSPDSYGWLGAAQRSTNALGGMSLMGVRVYNPLTGRFTSTDPVPGGSANPYEYGNQDPVNNFDLNGQWYVTWSTWTNRYGCSWFGCALTIRRTSFHAYWNRSETHAISYWGTTATGVSGVVAFIKNAPKALAPVAGGISATSAYLATAAWVARIRGECLGVRVELYGLVPYPSTFLHNGSHC